MNDNDSIRDALTTLDFERVEQASIPARLADVRPVPETLTAPLRKAIEKAHPAGLYAHQVLAIEASQAGEDVALATPTASGKSLVFMATALQTVLTDPRARVLVLYPARALVQDQLQKWQALAEQFGVRVGRIDGTILPAKKRFGILFASRIVVMTPDVVQAWLMGNLSDRIVHAFMSSLSLLVLDESHVYDGVFGTNMAFLLRRLAAVAPRFRLICSTATIDQPARFFEQLAGRRVRCFTAEHDGSATPEKTIDLVTPPKKRAFETTVGLLEALAQAGPRPFLAFGDSRRMVEEVVAAMHRKDRRRGALPHVEVEEGAGAEDGHEGEVAGHDRDSVRELLAEGTVLPYRAGYEVEDREAIQCALQEGRLAGVVSTSAMELGIDIGEIELVVLLSPPHTVKAFWQRLGRAGRRGSGRCILIDPSGDLSSLGGLKRYTDHALEPNRLYLDNRYLQYAHALCAATELGALGLDGTAGFEDLPAAFRSMLDNELDPKDIVPGELYQLKQRAQAGPHHEFPLRSAIEPTFQVEGAHGSGLGTLSLAQLMREAYPGAVYRYLGRAYRVRQVLFREKKVKVHREKHITTRPKCQVMVFPDFAPPLAWLRVLPDSFVAETNVQVSERVTGFTEHYGKTVKTYSYGPGSPHSQTDLNRFFQTTGVCFHAPEVTGEVAAALMEAFCTLCGIQPGDVGVGPFHAKGSPLGPSKCQGFCIYDSTFGSLRLTEALALRLDEVVAAAMSAAQANDEVDLAQQLEALARRVARMREPEGGRRCAAPSESSGAWVRVIAAGARAMYVGNCNPIEVTVLQSHYTPKGLMYRLEHPDPSVRWMVVAGTVQPLNGSTRTIEVNFETGEERAA